MQKTWIVALPLLAACGMSEIKAQNEAMRVKAAQNAAAAQTRQESQNTSSFKSLQDSLETAYRSAASRLDQSEADWEARSAALPAAKRTDPRFAAAERRHREIAAEMQALITKHEELVQWASAVSAPAAQESQKLAQGYTTLQQKQQILMSDFGALRGTMAQLGQ